MALASTSVPRRHKHSEWKGCSRMLVELAGQDDERTVDVSREP